MKSLMVVCVFLCVGCAGVEALYGTYDGSAELFNATNLGMRTNMQDYLVTLTQEPDASLVLGLTSKCSVRVTLEEASGALTVEPQTCMWDGQRTTVSAPDASSSVTRTEHFDVNPSTSDASGSWVNVTR